MSSVDLSDEERQMVETILDILETLAARLNTGEPIPNAILGDVVDFLRELEDAACEAGEAIEGQRLSSSNPIAKPPPPPPPMTYISTRITIPPLGA